MRKIEIYEPYFFIFFGLFHLHRIWAIIDRYSYSNFWITILNQKGLFYYLLMGFLAILCILGITTFLKNLGNNYWWRWIYLLGGGYVLFDLIAIATELSFWNKLLIMMFDISNNYWNMIWLLFIIMGGLVFILGIYLLNKRKEIKI